MKVVADKTIAKLDAICDMDYGFRSVVLDTLKALRETIPDCGDAGFACWNESELDEMIERISFRGPTPAQWNQPTKE